MKQVFLFVPDTLVEEHKCGYAEGRLEEDGDALCCYITSNKLVDEHDCVEGCCGRVVKERLWVYFDGKSGGVCCFNGSNMQHYVSCVHYDYKTIVVENACKIVDGQAGTKFNKLIEGEYWKTHRLVSGVVDYFFSFVLWLTTILLKLMEGCRFLWQYSEFFIHLQEYFFTMNWASGSWKKQKVFSIRIRNVFFSMAMDVALGVLAVYFLLKYEREIIDNVYEYAEIVIQQLKQVLHTLMGSPGGLKLNDALNHSLAKFFFYHISLWRTFIEANHFLLPAIFRIFIAGGLFGISFQVAMFSDLISFFTFHVYCIYVYAARLYGIQIYGIEALWKLFIGRKFNPLRQRVDSFDYTVNQLFVGTLGFTILLFLLPTIFLYYSVFTLLRIVLLLVNDSLGKLRFILKNVSLYVIILWVSNSAIVRGSLDVSLRKNGDNSATIYATMKKLSLSMAIRKSLTPRRKQERRIAWGQIFKRVFTGMLL